MPFHRLNEAGFVDDFNVNVLGAVRAIQLRLGPLHAPFHETDPLLPVKGALEGLRVLETHDLHGDVHESGPE